MKKLTAMLLTLGAGARTINLRVVPGAEPTRTDVAVDPSWGPSSGALDVAGNGDGGACGEADDPLRVDWLSLE